MQHVQTPDDVSAGCDDDGSRARRRQDWQPHQTTGHADVQVLHPADAQPRRTSATSSVTAMASTAALVALTSMFALAHWQYWRRTGDPKGVAVAVQELVVATIALGRRRPRDVSSRPSEWCVAIVATYSVLLLRPGGHALWNLDAVWSALQVIGALAAMACVIGLGRSFGLVPAHRGVKRTFAYRFVRHPLYATYLISMTAYVASAPTSRNVAVYVVAVAFQLRRIFAEEALLSRDEGYRQYAKDVRWRLVPGVF